MSFKAGKYFAIQGRNKAGEWVYLEAAPRPSDDYERLRKIAKKAGRPIKGGFGNMNSWDEEDDYETRYRQPLVKVSDSPFALKVYDIETDVKILVTFMRYIRNDCAAADVDPNSIRLSVVESQVSNYVPEAQTDAEIELRKFALEKLSDDEKELLKVKHWEVYHKLGDRSMLPDDEDDG